MPRLDMWTSASTIWWNNFHASSTTKPSAILSRKVWFSTNSIWMYSARASARGGVGVCTLAIGIVDLPLSDDGVTRIFNPGSSSNPKMISWSSSSLDPDPSPSSSREKCILGKELWLPLPNSSTPALLTLTLRLMSPGAAMPFFRFVNGFKSRLSSMSPFARGRWRVPQSGVLVRPSAVSSALSLSSSVSESEGAALSGSVDSIQVVKYRTMKRWLSRERVFTSRKILSSFLDCVARNLIFFTA